jgi:RNA polymerase sigma factor (sigma-70 family)
MSEILQHLRRTVLSSNGVGMTDGELLEGFVTGRDEAAFAALVRRHAPMVWAVCRRVLPSHHDAEDAFQATFLVLVRKAASVVPREWVANWLYGVAHQTARNVRASAARRSTRERQVTELPEPAAREPDLRGDLRPVLDQELSRLPPRYRSAIVLCDLEGRTRKDAARQFGVPEGTLSGWLTRGRALLAKRLARHGLAVSGGTLAVLLSQKGLPAAVPSAAVSSTIHAATRLAAGQAAASGVLSAQVAILTQGVLRTMLWTKLKTATAVVLILGAGLGATGLIYHAQAGKAAEASFVPAQGPADEKAKGTDAQKPNLAQGATPQGKRDLKFTIGKATTYVTGPLDPDGYVDYETALNERLGKDISPENNANVLLWQAWGPQPTGTAMPPEFFRWLKVPAPAERGEYFVDLVRYAQEAPQLNRGEQTSELQDQRGRAAQRPWVEKEYPRIAGWLKANAKPLALVLAASKRPDYYSPLVLRKSPDEQAYGLFFARLPGPQTCGELARALAARALLHAGEGRFDAAWQDLLACHRLGRLVGRGGTLMETRVGVGINQIAAEADVAFLDRANPTAEQAQAWLRDLQRLPPFPANADKVDLFERFAFLDSVLRVRRGRGQILRVLSVLGERLDPQSREVVPDVPRALLDSLDWDAMLRSSNTWSDRVAAAYRVPDRAAREEDLQRIEAELQALAKSAGSPAGVIEALRGGRSSPKEVSQKLGDYLIGHTLRLIRQIQAATDRAEQEQRLLHLAFALAAYRHEHGRYPDRLAALAPGYLDPVPDDLFSGRALIYRPSGNGYLLYSVGVNGRDDGGHGSEDTPPGDDLRVRLPLPELKGK